MSLVVRRKGLGRIRRGVERGGRNGEEIFLNIFYPGGGTEFMADKVIEVAEELLRNVRHITGAR